MERISKQRKTFFSQSQKHQYELKNGDGFPIQFSPDDYVIPRREHPNAADDYIPKYKNS